MPELSVRLRLIFQAFTLGTRFGLFRTREGRTGFAPRLPQLFELARVLVRVMPTRQET
jgi:hypothetical protein